MRAMILEKIGAIETRPLALRDVSMPEPGPGQALVRVRCCALCRTDLHVVEGDLPQSEQKANVIPGHQVVGEVEALGSGCRRLHIGQRVGVAWLQHTDGTCLYCRRGRENLCEASRYTGYHVDGGYAEYVLAPEDFVYEIPESFGDVAASPLLCAGLVGYRALQRAVVPENGRLLLIGFGSSAHLVLQIALHRGYDVSVVTRSENHLQLARQLGAHWVGTDTADLPNKVDSAILFAPSGKLVVPALEALRRGGTLSLAGIHMSPIPSLDYDRQLYQERDIHPVTANTRADGEALLREAAAAHVQSHTTAYPLEQANEALADMKHSRIDGTGVLVM